MAEHTDHELTYDALSRTELSSVDADFLHRAAGASSFLLAFLESRGEERFTPALHWTLPGSLHRSAAGKARQVNPIDIPKTVGLREGWHDVRAGATHPLTHGASRLPCGRSRPHRNSVSGFRSVAYTEPRICQTECLTSCVNTKGEARCLF
jgi:hypothetical protein